MSQAASIADGTGGLSHPVVWDAIVRLAGRDIPLLGTVSMLAAFACTVLVAFLAGDFIAIALRAMRRRVSMDDEAEAWIRHWAEFLAALAFVLTPGFFHAATRIGPFHVLLLPLLAGLALATRLLATADRSLFERLKQGAGLAAAAAVLLGCAWFEMSLSKRILLTERLSFATFAAIGVFPLAVLAHLTRRHVLMSRKSYVLYFSVWALVLSAAGIASLILSRRGIVASRVVRHILDNGADAAAVVSDGPLDTMFFFMLPESKRLILLSRDGDVAYGRELAAWVGKRFPDCHELAYAAELGPNALVAECAGAAQGGVREAVLTPEGYFPTPEKWREGCSELAGMHGSEPCGTQLRAMLAAAGNRFASRFLGEGDAAEAWKISWEIVDSVDADDGAAWNTLFTMLERGYAATQEERDRLAARREEVGGLTAFGNRVPEGSANGTGTRRSQELSPSALALLQRASAESQTVSEAVWSREAIRRGMEGGLLRLEQAGAPLLALDCRLGDWKSAERDAVGLLRIDRGHAKANAVMGKLAGLRGDYRAAEHYLRRALAAGADASGAVAKDLAFARAHRNPDEGASLPSPPAALPTDGGNGRVPFGGFAGRFLASIFLIALTRVVESTVTRKRARQLRRDRRIIDECRMQMEEAFRAAERERNAGQDVRVQVERPVREIVQPHRSYHEMSEEEREARKSWARARLMKHPRNPNWSKDSDYLELVLESALGGCGEAMNKLGEYAFRRKAYVEAYYWALKAELTGLRSTGQQPDSILRRWHSHRSSHRPHRFHEGFYDDEYHFARAVMRIRGGVDREKGLARLRRLVEDEYEDAVLFVRKNGLEKEVGAVS